jgi:hypothetical protein
MTEERLPTRRRTTTRTVSTALLLLGGATTVGGGGLAALMPGTAGAATSQKLPGHLIGLTSPNANDVAWALSGTSSKKVITQVNLKTDRVLGAESVSPKSDAISLSANGATLALGTSGGAFPAVVWYNALTGRFENSASAPAPVTSVATNGAGNIITSLRNGGTGRQSVSLLGTSNGLGFTLNLALGTSAPVAVLPAPQADETIVLEKDGTVADVAFPAGTLSSPIATSVAARSMVINAAGTTLYVLSSGAASSTIVEIDLSTAKVINRLTAPGNTAAISLSNDGSTLYEAVSGAKSSGIRDASTS